MDDLVRSDALPWERGNAVPNEQIRANVAANIGRDVPLVKPFSAHDGVFVFVGGGPSLSTEIGGLRARLEAGEKLTVVTSGKTIGYLIENGVTPWGWLNVDTKPKMREYVGETPPRIRYFVSSASAPVLFDHLSSHDVWMLHAPCAAGEDDLYNTEDAPLIGGGCTTPTRAITLAYVLGFRTIEFYGVDSSYGSDGTYAYHKDVVHGLEIAVTDDGREFSSSAVWLMQAEEIDTLTSEWLKHDSTVRFVFHGDGLTQHLMRLLPKAA